MVHGQKNVGTEKGPDFLRIMGLKDRIKACGYLCEDHGDIQLPAGGEIPARKKTTKGADFPDRVGFGNKCIAESIYEPLKDPQKFVLTVGGDHSVGIGTISAALKARPDCVIVWIDAHADINTPSTSSSGSFHGMPVGIAMRLDCTSDYQESCEFQWLKDYPTLEPKNLVYIGLRDIDVPERELIKELNIPAYTMHHIDRYGIGAIMEEVVDYVGGRPMHVSFDIDACDPYFAGSTGTAVRGGLTYRESHFVCEMLSATGNLHSLDIVEVNPDQVPGEKHSTGEAAISIVESCLGKSLL